MSTLSEIAPKAEALILDFEGFVPYPEWPGYSSGITIGYGDDLGYCTRDEFAQRWMPFLSQTQFEILATVLGITGPRASVILPSVKGIPIREKDARHVFDTFLMPDYMAKTINTYPGSEELLGEAFGALVSLIYNRGTSLEGDRRTEMAAIAPLIVSKDLQGIANQFLAMRRLWPKQGDSDHDLYSRRTAEAKLITDSITS